MLHAIDRACTHARAHARAHARGRRKTYIPTHPCPDYISILSGNPMTIHSDRGLNPANVCLENTRYTLDTNPTNVTARLIYNNPRDLISLLDPHCNPKPMKIITISDNFAVLQVSGNHATYRPRCFGAHVRNVLTPSVLKHGGL